MGYNDNGTKALSLGIRYRARVPALDRMALVEQIISTTCMILGNTIVAICPYRSGESRGEIGRKVEYICGFAL